ncbi:S-adenosyl-L-methionine-dependent methyltransferase [Trametes elegans]|nr:S-adenosyl-L-methionine-dependent methyltransferase [Trametes elegans]
MASLAALQALHDTVGAALNDIKRVYDSKGLDYPSLDVPFYQHNADPSELSDSDAKRAAAEKIALEDPTVTKAANLIVAATGQLASSVHHPFFAFIEGVHAGHITAALGVLEASHVPEILRDAGPNGLHINDIARKVEEIRLGKDALSDPDVQHVDPIKLSHVLRALATHHWLREVKQDVYANNRLTAILDTGKPLEQIGAAPEKKYDETNGVAAFVGMCASEFHRSVTYLNEWLLPSRENARAKKRATPFNLAYQTDELFYEYLERPENALRLVQVGRAMSGAKATEGGVSIADPKVFEWKTLPQGSVVVDVGGGIGSVAVQLAEPHPNLHVVVQDRAQTIELAPKIWGAAHKELFNSGRVSFLAQDFFAPQPAALQVAGVGTVAHPAAYLVTRVLHNWPDAECIRILSRLRAAAGPDTKLVLHEIILPLACAEPKTSASAAETEVDAGGRALAPAGSPLLPNLGKAASASYLLDLTVRPARLFPARCSRADAHGR